MNELDALLIAAEYSGKSIDEILAAAQKAGHTNYMDNQERFLSLLSQNYIEGAFVLGQPVAITLAGKDRLKQLQNEASDRAEEKRQTRIQNQLSVASILVNLVTFTIGLIVEHYVGFIAFLSQLFR